MNQTQALVIFACVLFPTLLSILIVVSKLLTQFNCDKDLTEAELLKNEHFLARVSCLKHEVWRRIDEFDTDHYHDFIALPPTSTDSG